MVIGLRSLSRGPVQFLQPQVLTQDHPAQADQLVREHFCLCTAAIVPDTGCSLDLTHRVHSFAQLYSP